MNDKITIQIVHFLMKNPLQKHNFNMLYFRQPFVSTTILDGSRKRRNKSVFYICVLKKACVLEKLQNTITKTYYILIVSELIQLI